MSEVTGHAQGIALYLRQLPEVVEQVVGPQAIREGWYQHKEGLPQIGVLDISLVPITHERRGTKRARVQVTVAARSMEEARRIAQSLEEPLDRFAAHGRAWDCNPVDWRPRYGSDVQMYQVDYSVLAE